MERIPLPSTIRFEAGASASEGKLFVEPLYPGFGTTVGNSLRRILLSSLPGAAVIAMRISGAPHEFTALPKIQEDLLQILMNVKQLRFKLFENEIVKLKLSAKGERVVRASDIDPNSAVEIANPELPIVTLTSKDATFEMELWVQQGRGYETADARIETMPREVGVITIDAFYSPVRRVSFIVERARVGQMTNFDKLVMSIETDNTITCEDAVRASTEVLVEHFALIGSLGSKIETPLGDGLEEKTEPDAAEVVKPKRAKN